MIPKRLRTVVAACAVLACTTDTAVGPSTITALVVSPESASLPVGDTLRLTTIATDSRGIQYVGVKTQWSSGTAAVATVSSTGAVAGVAVGSAIITATVQGFSATAQIIVTPPPVIVTSADTVAFTTFANGPAPATRTVIVTNGSAGALNGITDTITYGPGAADWLAVTHSAPTAPDTLTLAIASTTFPSGAYVARLVLRASRASNSPDTVIVRLALNAGAATTVAPDSGDGQSAPVNTAVAVRPTVIVRDQFGNPVPDVPVTFAVLPGGGSVTGPTTTTDASGRARVGSWQLGTTVGVDSLTATAAPLPGSPVTFTATASPGAPSLLVKTAGDAQTATVNTGVATPPAVRVEDLFGNAVSGTIVTFAPTAGSGSVTSGVATADANGVATVGAWTLGTTAGGNTLTATVQGTGVTVSFTATGTPGPAMQIAAQAGDGQTAIVGTPVATPPAVRVSDQYGNAVAGVAVTFVAASGGGSVSGGSQSTNASGTATVGSWTLGSTSEPNTLTATAPGLSGSPVTFTATATADVATQIAVSAGNGQTATVNTTVAVAPAVLVRDQFNNPVPGVAVTFAVASGGGAITGANATTNASGVAAVGSWQLGTTAGPNSLTATAAGGGISGNPVTFTATGAAGSATQIAVNAGNGQSATVNTAVATAPAVVVRDQFNNAVSGVSVTFTVTAGGGSTSPASPAAIQTNASGIAALSSWTLGQTAGANTLQATATGLTGSPVIFTATGTPGPATQIAVVAGNNQSATVNSAVATAPSVVVRDQFNNTVSGLSVTFTVTGGGGSTTPTSPAIIVTQASGVAALTSWTLGTTAGTNNNTLEAAAGGLSGSPVQFTATALTGAAAQISKAAGDNQSATAGTTLPIDPAVFVGDQFGNPVAAVTVTFTVAPGNGSISGATPGSGANGLATLGSWTISATPGTNTLTATAPGLAGSPLTFTATGNSGSARNIALAGGNAQTDTVAATLVTAYSVVVTDSAGNPVSGVTVAWAVTGGGGSISPPTSNTNGSGIATATRTLGTTAGPQTATASVGGLIGSPVQFTATATAGAAAQLSLNAGNNQSATVNTAVSTAPSVKVSDQFGNPVQGRSVTFAVTAGGGSVAGGNATSNASGLAQVTSWTLGTTAGTNNNTLQAVSAGLAGSPVIFTASATAGAATQLAINAGNNQSATVNTAVATAPSVIVRDQFNNPVSGHSVTFTVTGGGGSTSPASPATVQTNASGIAGVSSWTLGGTTGTNNNTLQAASTGLTGSPLTFTASATAGAATQMAINAGNNQSATVNTAVATTPSVIVRDAANNPVSGVSVTFTVTAGGGSVSPATVLTNASGIAAVTSWTLGTSAGTNNNALQATSSGLSAVNFTASATAGAATQMTLNAGNGQSATVNTAVAVAPSVAVRDQFNNAVSGQSVNFTVTGGGGSTVPASPAIVTTNAGGIAAVTSWTLGTTAGTNNNTLQATSSGLTAVNFAATATAGPASASQSTVTSATATITACQTACVAGTTASTITVTARDQFNNAISSTSVTISATGTNNAFSPSATGTTNASGVYTATFSSTTAQAKTISAMAGGTGITQSASVTVNPDLTQLLANSIVTATTPITASNGSSPSTVTVTVRDQFANGVSGRTVTISVTGTGNTVNQPAATTNASGVATGSFSSTVAQSKTVTASFNLTGGGTIVDNAIVTVNPGSASQLVMVVQPAGATSNAAFTTQPQVRLRDAFGNNVLQSSVSVTASKSSGTGTLSGTVAASTNAGIAAWTNLSIIGMLTGYGNHALTFASSGLTSVTSTTFNVLVSHAYNIQSGIYNVSCSSCHTLSYANTVNQGPSQCGLTYIVPNDTLASDLWLRVRGIQSCGGVMPQTGVNPTFHDIIGRWIMQGAPNN